MSDVEIFGADREDIQSSKFKKYRSKMGQSDRVGVIFFNGDPKQMFKGVKAHFKERYFLCKSTKDKKEVCCLHSYERNKPSYRIGCVVVKYEIGKKDDGKVGLKGYEVLPWVFSDKMYQKLVTADGEFPLKDHDIKLTCTNEEYQTLDIQSCKESLWTTNETLKKKILEEATGIWEDMSRGLANDLSITEIKELLGIEMTGSADAATDVDMAAVVDGL